MGTIAVFTQNENRKKGTYDLLAGLPDIDVEYHTFAEEPAVLEGGDLDVAIIDSGTDAAAGLNLLQEIKKIRSDLPIVFATEASSEEVVLNAYQYGAREYFRKPFDPARFREAVARIINFRRRGAGHGYPDARPPVPPPPLPERLRRVVDYLEENLEIQHSLEEIAEVACLSKYHFCRLFKRHLGMTPIQFMLDLRIRHAAALLRDTGLSVTSVAARSGFSDLSCFHKQFKRTYRCTPSVYRKTVRPRKPVLFG